MAKRAFSLSVRTVMVSMVGILVCLTILAILSKPPPSHTRVFSKPVAKIQQNKDYPPPAPVQTQVQTVIGGDANLRGTPPHHPSTPVGPAPVTYQTLNQRGDGAVLVVGGTGRNRTVTCCIF